MAQKITDISQIDINASYIYTDYLAWQFSETVELIKGKIMRMSPAPRNIHQLSLGIYLPKYECTSNEKSAKYLMPLLMFDDQA